MKPAEQDKLIQQIKSTLDESVAHIDQDTRYQLQMARAKVLQSEATPVPWHKRVTAWSGIASFVSISIFAAFLYLSSPGHPLSNDAEMMATLLLDSDDGIELYEQYDFYIWLSQQKNG